MSRSSEVALVTGAGSGIGRATAIRLARRASAVVLLDLSEEGLAATASDIERDGGTALSARTDVSDENQVRAAIERAKTKFGPLRTVAACAGIEVLGTALEMDTADWHKVLAVNLTGVFHTARHAIPAILEAGGGAFVALSSDAGVQGAQGFAAYCASKHGVIGLVRCLALDHGAQGVRSNVVCPGFVETPMASRIFDGMSHDEIDSWAKTVPLGRFAQPEEVAASIAYLTSDEASYVNGQVHTLDGGATAGYYTPT